MNKYRTAIQIAFLILLLTAACSTIISLQDPCSKMIRDMQQTPKNIIKGYYLAEFEVSSFVPCGCDAEPGYGQGYWLAFDSHSGFGEAYQLSNSGQDLKTRGSKVYVEFEGEISGYGPHGHQGMYLREVTVSKLLLADIEGKCP